MQATHPVMAGTLLRSSFLNGILFLASNSFHKTFSWTVSCLKDKVCVRAVMPVQFYMKGADGFECCGQARQVTGKQIVGLIHKWDYIVNVIKILLTQLWATLKTYVSYKAALIWTAWHRHTLVWVVDTNEPNFSRQRKLDERNDGVFVGQDPGAQNIWLNWHTNWTFDTLRSAPPSQGCECGREWANVTNDKLWNCSSRWKSPWYINLNSL